jgi:hypothetical protein
MGVLTKITLEMYNSMEESYKDDPRMEQTRKCPALVMTE